VKACRQGRSSRSTAVIHTGRRSWWRPVIISAKAVTWPAVAFSCGLRALIFASLAVSSSVSWPGWLVIHRLSSPDGRRGQRERRSGKRGAQRLQVAPHRSLAALVALRGDLGVQQGAVGAALVPALLQVGGEMVLTAGARARADDHLAGGGGAGELADGVPRQAQHLGDLGVVLALREQVMDRGVAFPAAAEPGRVPRRQS
jgi:hypothetical protein